MGQARQRGTYEQRKEIAIKAREVVEAIATKKRQEERDRQNYELSLSRARMDNGRVVVGSTSQMGGLSHNNYHDRVSLYAGLGAVVIDHPNANTAQRLAEEIEKQTPSTVLVGHP